MAQYRKKPIVIDAFLWTGGPDQAEDPEWAASAFESGEMRVGKSTDLLGRKFTVVRIKTLEGTMMAVPGDYIIKGVKGEIYPCKADIFEATYDKVEA